MRDLTLMVGRVADTQVAARGLSLALAGEGPGRLRGRAVVSKGWSVQHSGTGIRLDRARADLAFTGTILSLRSIAASSPVATLAATARLDISRGDLDARYDAQINLAQLRQWWTDAPPVGGAVTVAGTVAVSLSEPVATFVARGERLRWRDATDITVSASGRWSAGDLVITRYRVSSGTAGTQVSGRVRLAVAGGGRTSSLQVDARAGDLRRLGRLARMSALPAVPLTLGADLSWPGFVPQTATLGGRVRIVALNTDSPGTPLATAEASGQGGRWTVRQHGALDGGTRMAAHVSVAVDPSTLSHSTIDGRIAAQSESLAPALRDLRRKGLSWANVEAVLQSGRAITDATVAGTLARPRIRASVTADSLTLQGVENVRVDAQLRANGRHVEIARMTATAPGNRIDVYGMATAGAGPVDLNVSGELERLETLATWLPPRWRPGGSLVVSGRLTGSSSSPSFAGRISGTGLEANGIVVEALDGGVKFEGGVLHVRDLRLNYGEGWLRLDGDIERRLEYLSLRGEGKNFTLSVNRLSDARLLPANAASPGEDLHLDNLSLEFDIGGSPMKPTGTISASADLSFEGRRVGPLAFSAEGSDGRTLHVELELPNERANITGAIRLEHAWPFDAHASLRASQLASLLALMGPANPFPDGTGTVTAAVDLAGTFDRPFESSVVLTLSELEGQLRGRALRLVQPGRVRFDGGNTFVEEPIRLTVGGVSIGMASPPDECGRVIVTTLEGRIEDGFALLPHGVAITPWIVEGAVRAQISLNHVADHVAISGEADARLDRLRRAGRELARDVRVRAQIGREAIEFPNVEGTVLGGPFIGTGRLPISWILPSWFPGRTAAATDGPPGEALVSVRADVTLTRAFQALGITRNALSGSAAVAIDARATAPRLEDVDAMLEMESGEVVINTVHLAQQRPTRLRFNNGRLEVTDLAWKGPRSELTASGAIGLLPGVEGDLRAEGTAALSLLQAIAPGAGGETAFQLQVSGPSGSRRVSADVALNDVSFIAPKQQVAIAALSGTLTLDGNVLEARGLRAQMNGGELTIDGGIPVRARVAVPHPLKVEGRGLFVEIPKGLRSQLDTSLRWENAGTVPRLSGQVTIASETYREPITSLAALAASLSSLSPARALTLPPWIAATLLDIHLHSVGPLVINQSVLKIEMVPDLELTGTLDRPSLNGQLTIQDDGRIQVGGRTYRMTDSRLEFSPATGLLPRLNVIGETRVNSYHLTLQITGPLDEIQTSFSSDPPLSERDVRSLLITGQIADPARGSTDTDRFAVGAVSGDVLGLAGQFVGLDSVRVGTEDLDLVASDVNPSTRLTVSKRLGSKFELVLSENLEESQSTWIVIYRPVGGYEFRLSSEDNTTQGFEFRQEITFGPGVAPHARVKSVGVVPEKVRSVTLVGQAGFPARQVLAGTAIRAGDRFDFREWLNDRDRISRFYRDRQYFTARIVPMRIVGEGTAKERLVDLQYRITRGPRTVLEVTGYRAGDDFLERLHQTWSESVLLDLLRDRLARTARDYLVDAGFLRARIEVEVDRPEPGTGRARIHIEPGPRTDSRRLAFSGNHAIASKALQDLATSRGLDSDAWKDPIPLLAEIRTAYAAKGYLGARATAEPIEFSNGAATLRIRIDEGPSTRVASLRLTGVGPERRSGALAAIALPVGASFTSGTVRAGRARLERHYRDLGYRDVRVAVTVTGAAQGPDMVLAFAVNEGSLHVVRSVEIAGVQSTRASLVTNAVGLAPGEPAGAAAALAAQRRLHELGTFRRAELRFEPEPGPLAAIVPVKAIVSVEEARRFQFRYGIELSSEYNSSLSQRANAVGVAGDIQDRNFLGRGMSLGGGLRYEPDLRSARSLFSVPRLAGRPIRTTVYLTGRGEEDTSAGQVRVRDDEIELSIEQRRRVGRAVEYSWGYSANWRDTQLTSAISGEPLAFAGTLASLNGAAVIDRRDSFFDAKRGWFGSVSVQWGQRAFGSELDYLRTLLRGSYYQPFGPLVLAGNVRWGRLFPLGGETPLTVFDLFFNAGGTESVRGYSQDELTAYDFLGAPLGGTKLFVVNGELRSPLFWRLGGVLFVDAGNTFAELQPILFRDLAVGLGVGLRINTPLAPVRIDFGFPRSLGKAGARWHFSIGQMF